DRRLIEDYLPIQAISAEACRRIVEISELPYQPEVPLEEQLMRLAQAKLELLGSKDFLRLVRVTVAEKVRRPEVVEEAFAEISKGEFGATLWIRAAARDGRLRVDDSLAASLQFSALLKEFALWPQLFGTRPPLSASERTEVARKAVRMFLDHYQV
ncbi:MAG TPA: TetR/AcrR family transcriptional regulator C-terminal domain-containing protein, partial [Planctomycetota bacterium]|nr:TetR/AcrR family transcriptional regulator C-terminal domain-containing protein [Planctomycetota bacterium]